MAWKDPAIELINKRLGVARRPRLAAPPAAPCPSTVPANVSVEFGMQLGYSGTKPVPVGLTCPPNGDAGAPCGTRPARR